MGTEWPFFANLWITVCSGNSKPVCLGVMGITLLLNSLCIFLGRVRTLCRILVCVPTCDAWSQHHTTAVEREHLPNLRHQESQRLLLFQVQKKVFWKRDSTQARLTWFQNIILLGRTTLKPICHRLYNTLDPCLLFDSTSCCSEYVTSSPGMPATTSQG